MDLRFIHNKKVVLLFTSGLDSYLSRCFLEKENINYVYFVLKNRYSLLERQLVEGFNKKLKIDIYNDILNLSTLEKPDAYIPNRNSLLVTLAQSLYDADVVLLNGFKDDRVSDNNENFYKTMSNMLSVSADKRVTVTSIFKDFEKSEIVREVSQHSKDVYDLAVKTYSCYSGNKTSSLYTIFKKDINENFIVDKEEQRIYGCMKCKACFRKMCALTAANLYIEGNFDYKMFDFPEHSLYPNRFKTIVDYSSFRHIVQNKKLPEHL